MKKFIKKNLAVILSFAIILTTLLPVLTGLGSVSALSTEVAILKKEWANLEYIGIPDEEGFKIGIWQNDGNTYKEADTGPYKIGYDANVDAAYGANQFTATGVASSTLTDTEGAAWYRINGDDKKSQVTLSAMGDMVFWYKASADASAQVKVLGGDKKDTHKVLGTVNVTLVGDNTWKKYSVRELMGETAWSTLISTYPNYKLQRVSINLSTFAEGVGTLDVSFGALNYFDRDASLDGSANWTEEQWVENALQLDLSKYENTSAFEAALYAALESVTGVSKAHLAAKGLIEAWNELSYVDNHNILPNRWWNVSEDVASANMADSSTYAGALPEGVSLGSKYATFTDLGDEATAESKQCILYEFKDGSDGSFNGYEHTMTYNIDDIDTVYFWIKIDNMSKDAKLRISVRGYKFSDVYFIPEIITIPASKSGEWVKISLKDETANLWHGNITGVPLHRVMVALNNVSGATVSVGSGIIQRKVGAPDGAETMAPEDLLAAAMELDLSKYGNTEKFIEKMDALKLYCEEDMAINGLKKAINGLSSYTDYHIYPRRYWDANGTICSADTYVTKVSEYTGSLPEGADSSNVGTYLGEKMATISELTDMAAAYKTSGNKQTVLYECNNMSTTPFTSHQIEDMYFWYKLEGAASAKIINGMYVSLGSYTPFKIEREINLIGDGQWHKVSFNEVYGNDWISANDIADGKVYRILMSIGEAKGGTITLGSIETIASAGLVPSNTDAWSIADWIAFASRLNITPYIGVDKFEEALAYAKEVRDRLMIARGFNLTEFDDVASADAEGATISADNVFEALVPTVYHSADGESKNAVEGTSFELFTDNDSSTIGAVSGLDNSNEKSFTQFVYKFAGEANISDFIIYNDAANIADKYYIYTANTESELFLQENLLVAYNNEGKVAQRFNFDGRPEVKSAYVGIRVFGGTDTVSFAEFKAFGEVITYGVETGNFSNTKIANIGKNLLDGVNPKIKTLLKLDWKSFVGTTNGYQPYHLTDNDVNTPVGFSNTSVRISEKDDTISMHIYYDLGTTYNIEKLLLNSHNGKGIETGKYEIYASKDVNSLFLSRSKVLSYDNMVDGPNGTTISQLFTLKNEVVARYVSFHITYPISDWDYRITTTGKHLFYPRLSELGVYGTEWVKPYALVNLTSHVPMDIFRTDSSGKRTEVGEDEYNGSEHKLTYDGKEETSADVKIKNGETLDFVYNLAAEMTLEEIKFKVANGTVKKMNIYASTVEDKIWKQESLIYSDVNGLGKTEFGKSFAGAPLKARYIRFEIIENDGEDLVISEVEAIGGNDQEFNYMNLAEEKPESASFYLQEVGKGGASISTQYGKKWKWSWNRLDDLWPINKAFDNDNDSVYDLYGGKNGEESVNILLDLGTLNSIDGITLVGGSESVYWPDEMNYYFGDDEAALFQKDAKPAQKWMQSTADGVFTYEFVPQVAQYVRIEFVRAEDPVYSQYSDAIATIIGEIQVNGLELKSRAVNGVCATVEDEKTGIKAEILALRENDVFDTIQSMTVVKRKPTADELASAKEQNLKVDTDIYEIYFLDVNGDIVTNTGDREVVIYIPQKLSAITEDIFVLLGEFGGLSMIEFDSADGYYCFTIDDISSALNVALGYMVEDEEEFDDFDDSDYEDEEEFEEDEEEEDDDDKPKKKKKVKVIRKNKGENGYLWIIVAAVAGAVVVAAGVILFIILKKKKNKENEE